MTTRHIKALLVCNGEAPARPLVRHLASNADIIVAADGGANIARRFRIRPEVIVGDLDSIQPATKKYFGGVEMIRLPRQDNTDLEKALDLLVERGVTEVALVGATGGRIDFTLGNLSVIWNYTARLRITVFGEGWKAIPVSGFVRLRARLGTTVSIVPFGTARGVTLRGLKYPLTNATLDLGRIGVSNVVSRSPFSVGVKNGHLLLIVFSRQPVKRPIR